MKADVIIVGSGAAGMMCAIQAGKRGRSVVLIDHAKKLAEKIRISGGGRCNFTNLNIRPENFISANPDFCRSALARYTPQDFIALLRKHNIRYHEKALGQLFCDDGSEAIIAMLRDECDAASVKRFMDCEVEEVKYSPPVDGNQKQKFHVVTSRGKFNAGSLVIATGGLAVPKTGATPFGYHVAEQFSIPITKLKPGLVPLSFAPDDWKPYAELTGVSLDVITSFGRQSFREAMLLTHRGLSGPAILQISSYWQHGQPLHIDLLPDCDMAALLNEQKGSKKLLSNYLAQWFPKSFAEVWCAQLKDI
ncbi:MAG: NAD(P)/FAD-dependent oxidoreductase, partial [Gallionellaceae bacterium]|nr:NAD(P)/FAD-dependent oxidoreductase [Gallionellaceae bacterium]